MTTETIELVKLAQSLVVMLKNEQKVLTEIKAMAASNGNIAYRNGSQIRDLALAIDALKTELNSVNQTITAMIEHSITRTVVHDAKDKKIDELIVTVKFLVQSFNLLSQRMPDLFTD